jgi:hypothetical protein
MTIAVAYSTRTLHMVEMPTPEYREITWTSHISRPGCDGFSLDGKWKLEGLHHPKAQRKQGRSSM